MSKNDKTSTRLSQPPRPLCWRDDIILVPVNQPIPPGRGIEWWLKRVMGRG